MTAAQICSFILIDVCPDGYDPNHEWSVQLPPVLQEDHHITKPPADNVPRLKVLQISDIHYDPLYTQGSNAECDEPLCCRNRHGRPKTPDAAAGKWGMYKRCDTPHVLLVNALEHIAETHKDIDYIMWTGDVPPHDIWEQTHEDNVKNLKECSKLLDRHFKGIPIYPSVGNHEACPLDSYAPKGTPKSKDASRLYKALDEQWGRWLPPYTSKTIRRGAYYSVLVKPGLRLIAVNGNYCSRNNFWLLTNSTDPMGHLAWLVRELEVAEANNEKVHIMGHIPPGGNDCVKVWSRNYYDIINRFESIIMAQFFGHTHYDEFEVFYDNKEFKRPINVGYVSPSITPWELTDPSYRIYYVNADNSESTGAIVDHETWKMDLAAANKNDKPVWTKLYSAREAYGMPSLLPKDWDDLVTRMSKDPELFDVYHRNFYRDSPVVPKCDENCRKKLLCNIKSGRSGDEANLCRDLFL